MTGGFLPQGESNAKYVFILWRYYVSQSPFLYKRPDGLTSSAATLTLGPEIEPLGHIIEIHIKVPPLNLRPEIWSIWGLKMTRKYGLWGQYSTHWRLMQIQWKLFAKMTKDRNFYLFLGPKVAKNWASEAHILHKFESTCNEHVKQYCCETSENFLRKRPNTRNLTNFGAQNGPQIGPLRPIFCKSLKAAPISI